MKTENKMVAVRFFGGFTEIAEGLIHILSLGFMHCHLSYMFYMWTAEKFIYKKKKEMNEIEGFTWTWEELKAWNHQIFDDLLATVEKEAKSHPIGSMQAIALWEFYDKIYKRKI